MRSHFTTKTFFQTLLVAVIVAAFITQPLRRACANFLQYCLATNEVYVAATPDPYTLTWNAFMFSYTYTAPFTVKWDCTTGDTSQCSVCIMSKFYQPNVSSYTWAVATAQSCTNGNSQGFTTTWSGLSKNTTYYVNVYMKQLPGGGTCQGDQDINNYTLMHSEVITTGNGS